MNRPRIGIVSSSALTKYNRWDAEFYLGADEALQEKIERAKVRVEQSQRSLEQAQIELQQDQERTRRMEESGEVKRFPIKPD